MWFDSWSDVWRVLLVGPASYVALVLILRLSGKRTLAKLNAFDLVVTVALGSTLATIFLSTEVSWSEGVAALGALALLQFLVAAATDRVSGARAFITGTPTLVFRDGRMLGDAMRGQRLGEPEVRQAIRSTGIGDVATVAAVVLETDGTLSVVPASKAGDGSALEDARRVD